MSEYIPTLDEIASHCLAIQKTWSDDERLRRMRVKPKCKPAPSSVRRDAHAAMLDRLLLQRELG